MKTAEQHAAFVERLEKAAYGEGQYRIDAKEVKAIIAIYAQSRYSRWHPSWALQQQMNDYFHKRQKHRIALIDYYANPEPQFEPTCERPAFTYSP